MRPAFGLSVVSAVLRRSVFVSLNSLVEDEINEKKELWRLSDCRQNAFHSSTTSTTRLSICTKQLLACDFSQPYSRGRLGHFVQVSDEALVASKGSLPMDSCVGRRGQPSPKNRLCQCRDSVLSAPRRS